MNHSPFWCSDEDAIIRRMDKDGATVFAMAAALPGRSQTAVSRRRRFLGGERLRGTYPQAPLPRQQRITQLVATIERVRRERRAKAYVRELRKGLIMLHYREQAG